MAEQRENRLSTQKSPYLRQHMYNPVEWYPWGEEALTRAREEQKMIFLSIGYAACHWCHVMERESFEDPQIARYLAEHFISIKVDREERPDLDAIYMDAVVALTKSGGWPLNCFLTPDLKPFYGGTYFPPVEAHGRPAFGDLLRHLVKLWEQSRGDVVEAAQSLVTHLGKRYASSTPASAEGFPEQLQQVLMKGFDQRNGGFGPRPKFPQTGPLEFLLSTGEQGREAALFTLRKMAAGGLFDQVGGGFHRYSVDEHWLVPHFEKMLYDNALLAKTYTDAYSRTRDPSFRRTAEMTLEFMLAELRSPRGAFHASLDADVGGREGEYYLWTAQELREHLGEGATPFMTFFNAREGGNFPSELPEHRGQNILHRSTSDPDEAINEQLRVLASVRRKRTAPAVDTKVITAWNGLAVSALSRAAIVFDRPDFLNAAREAADHLLTHMADGERLARSSCEGVTSGEGVLEDYIFLIEALGELYEATLSPGWLMAANRLMAGALEQFRDPAGGALLFAAGKDLVMPVKRIEDGALPSANARAMLQLHKLGRLFSEEYEVAAEGIVRASLAVCGAHPGACPSLAVTMARVENLRTIVITGSAQDPLTSALLEGVTAHRRADDLVLVAHMWDELPPYMMGYEGEPAVYVCTHGACLAPIVDPSLLHSLSD